MSERTANNRFTLRAASLLASVAALTLGAANVSANDWHYQWGSTPVIRPSGSNDAHGSCPYSLPAGAPANTATVGLHSVASWVQLDDWTADLGYSPEAMSYYLCTNNQGSSTWTSSPFFSFWMDAHPTDATRRHYTSVSPHYFCPSGYPYTVGAFCQTRALW